MERVDECCGDPVLLYGHFMQM